MPETGSRTGASRAAFAPSGKYGFTAAGPRRTIGRRRLFDPAHPDEQHLNTGISEVAAHLPRCQLVQVQALRFARLVLVVGFGQVDPAGEHRTVRLAVQIEIPTPVGPILVDEP